MLLMAFAFGLVLTTLIVTRTWDVTGRTRTELGSVSEQWMAAHIASSHTPSG